MRGVFTAARARARARLTGALTLLPLLALTAQAQPRPARDDSALSNESPLSELRARARAGDTDGALLALAALPADYADRPNTRYLKARLLEKKDRVIEALDTLPQDLSSLPPIVERDIQTR